MESEDYFSNDYDSDGEIDFEGIAEHLETNVLKDVKECPHYNIESYPDGSGYCKDCSFLVDDILSHCKHSNTLETENGLTYCKDCGIEIEKLDFKPEWRYYHDSDNRSMKDPSRCQNKGNSKTTLDDILQRNNIEVKDVIKSFIEIEYKKIIKNEKSSKRGNEAKSIICACHMYVLRRFGEYRTTEYMRNMYNLKKNKMTYGIATYLKANRDDRATTTKPEDLIKWIMRITGVEEEHYSKILALCKYFENTHQALIRSNPRSVASAYIYFYLCLKPEYQQSLGLTKSKFARKAGLSDITITKLVRTIASISEMKINV